MNNLLLDLFSRNCPCCHNVVPWKNRKQLLKKNMIKCPSCSETLSISTRDKFINGLFLLGLLNYGLSVLLPESPIFKDITLLFLILPFDCQKYLNVFFSLEKTSKTHLNQKTTRG